MNEKPADEECLQHWILRLAVKPLDKPRKKPHVLCCIVKQKRQKYDEKNRRRVTRALHSGNRHFPRYASKCQHPDRKGTDKPPKCRLPNAAAQDDQEKCEQRNRQECRRTRKHVLHNTFLLRETSLYYRVSGKITYTIFYQFCQVSCLHEILIYDKMLYIVFWDQLFPASKEV